MRSAVLFPGLAPAGYALIGNLLSNTPAGRDRIAEAERVLDRPLLEEFRAAGAGGPGSGPGSPGGTWEATDCAYLACAVALADHLPQLLGGERPRAYAGVSFGGFAATVAAGGLDYADAVRLVSRSARAQARYLAGRAPAGCLFCYRIGASAVADIVAELRAAGRWVEISADLGMDVYGISATLDTLELVKAEVRARGGAPIYTMDRPQHCSTIAGLRSQLAAQVYPHAQFRVPRLPLISDVDGSLACTPDRLRDTLLDGWTEPVHLRHTVAALRRLRVQRIYLVGPRSLFARLLGDAFDLVPVEPDVVPVGPDVVPAGPDLVPQGAPA